MADDVSAASDLSLAWLWVIEYLASFKEIDPSTLHDLIEAAPELPDDLGKNARERVALRCLEDLFGYSDGVAADEGVRSLLDSKVEFSLSESCEEVMQSILQETSVSDLRMGCGPELLKWDICPFILHKRASMPKCALEQLKDAILVGTHPYSTCTKEHSGLVHNNNNNHLQIVEDASKGDRLRIPDNGSNHNEISCIDGCGTNVPIMAPEWHSSVLLHENGVVEDDSWNGNLLRLKRDRSDFVEKDLAGDDHENQGCMDDGVNLNSNAKRHKQDHSYTYEMKIEGSRKEDCIMEMESQSGGLGENRPLENDCNEWVYRNPCADDEFQNRCETSFNASTMIEHAFRDPSGRYILVDEADDVKARTSNDACCARTNREVSLDEAKDNSDLGNQLNPANGVSSNEFHGKINVEGADCEDLLSEEETSSGSDKCDHERVDVDMKKSHFLSSQGLSSDWTEQNFCVKCNKGGELLVCNFASCPLVVHEKCLGTSPRFDEMGKFFCPFCAYSLAISEYLEAKKKASLARKQLSAFIHKGLDHCPKEQTERLHEEVQNNSRQSRDDLLHQVHVNENSEEREHNQIEQQLELSATDIDLSLRVRGGDLDATNTERGREDIAQKCQSLRGLDRKRDQSRNTSKANLDIVLFKEKETDGVSRGQGKGIIQQEVGRQLVIYSSEKHDYVGRDNLIRIRKRDTQYTYPAIPQLRRRKVLWTAKEEEVLKEGVEKFSSVYDRNIPWKKILEYGGSVFQSGRTSVDLKDKWRNMCRGSPKSK